MSDWIKWDADEVSQGIRILEGANGKSCSHHS